MRAAGRFARHLADDGLLPNVAPVRIELYGSLGATGAGHGTPGAVMLGLEGCEPETVDPAAAHARVDEINTDHKLVLAGTHTVDFHTGDDLALSLQAMDFHSNGMVFLAYGVDDAVLSRRVYYSVGGGFVVDEEEAQSGPRGDSAVPYPFNTAAELVRLATDNDYSIAELMARNEAALGREPDLRAGLLRIWAAMRDCVEAAGPAADLGGSPAQVENAAEIGIEHNLGLACDPVGGLVQIPCIERNAVASVKAITAARMALHGDGTHHVSLDTAIKTMRDTGADMKDKYEETSQGGLALNVVEC
jgi:L-serine deaminase